MSTSLVISELIMTSSKIQHVVGVTAATDFVQKGTVWRKLLDSSLYDFSKWMVSKYPHEFDPKSDDFKAFFDVCFQAWCGAFKHFELLRFTKIECSAKNRMCFPAYMRHHLKMFLLIRRRQENMRKKLYQPVSF